MSIALEIGAGIRGAKFICGIGCVPIYDSLEIGEDPSLSLESPSSSSSFSSSIGKGSDDVGSKSGDDEGAGMGEVQSAYKGLLQGMESIEESLPIRRGISSFYAGKAKSFTSLSDGAACCTSAKDLAKAENAYTRRRRNLFASKISCEKQHRSLLRSPVGGIAKRPGAPRRSHLALAMAMSSSPRSNNGGEHEDDNSQLLPSVRQQGKPTVVADSAACSSSSSQICCFSMRSFSLGDLPVLKNLGSPIGPSGEQ